jgi:hypothetical protein
MSSSADSPSQAGVPRGANRPQATRWVVLASVLLIILGAINILNGYTLIEHHSYFRKHILLVGGLTGWGWVFIIWGAVQLAAGVVAWSGRMAGYVLGVGVCAIGAMIWFILVFTAPWAALVGIALNVAVIFALTSAWPDRGEPSMFD